MAEDVCRFRSTNESIIWKSRIIHCKCDRHNSLVYTNMCCESYFRCEVRDFTDLVACFRIMDVRYVENTAHYDMRESLCKPFQTEMR